MKKDIFEELPDEQKFDELNYDNLLLVLDTIKSEPEYNHCIIFDDMGAYLKDNVIRKLLKEIIFMIWQNLCLILHINICL